MDDPYIDIDDDSNTQHSNVGFASNSNGPSTSGRANNNSNRNGNQAHTASANYIDPLDLASDRSLVSSDYSDWAEEDGRKTLKPPPRKAQRKQRTNRTAQPKRRLRINDEDEDEEPHDAQEDESMFQMAKIKRTTLSKKLKKIISDEDDDEDTDQIETINPKGCSNKGDELDEQEESDEDDEDIDEESSPDSEDEDDYADTGKPCTSQAAHARTSKSTNTKRKKKKHANKLRTASKSLNRSLSNNIASRSSKLNESLNLSKSIKSKAAKVKGNSFKPVNTNVIYNECPPEYRPPEWLTSTKPKKSPYVPQIGDEVVYFRQGHELYVNAVKANNVYEIDEQSLPWKTKQIEVQEYCKVVGMKVEIKPPRLVCLKLGVIEQLTGKLTGVKFNIKYHDMLHVVDFVVLRQFYERAIEKNWRAKDRFRCIIDDNWYFGVIESKTPYQEEYPNSDFNSLKIVWDNGDQDTLSPWDLEPLSGVNARKTKPASSIAVPNNGEGVLVTADEIKSLLYQPEKHEWPIMERDYECERILAGNFKIYL